MSTVKAYKNEKDRFSKVLSVKKHKNVKIVKSI